MASRATTTVEDTHPSAQKVGATFGRSNRCSTALHIGASLLWIPQAAFIALAIGDLTGNTGASRLQWLCLGIPLIGILRATLDFVGARGAFREGRKQATKLRREAVSALARRSPLDADRAESGRAAAIIAEQAELVVPYVARFEAAKAKAVAVPCVIFLVIMTQSWAAGFVLLLAAPLIPIFMILIGWNAKKASEAQLVRAGDMNAFLLDRLRGIKTIRALAAVDRTALRLRANAENLRIRTMAVLRIAFLSSAVLELVSALGVAMVAVYVGFHLLGQLNFGTWSGPLDLAQGLFILILAPAFFEPLRDLSVVWHDRASGQAAIEALTSLSCQGITIVGGRSDDKKPAKDDLLPPGIQIDQVSFDYGNAKDDALSRFDLSIAPGEHIAILGPSGSGKSTLLALLAGLAPATSGCVTIGELKLSEESAGNLRSRTAWIGQRPHIFPGTLTSNVSLGRNIPDRRIFDALRFAKLIDIAEKRGPDTIGEGGTGLSGGETLRLAIARIAAQPDVTLILADEPTAHLDAETAREVTDNLLALARGKTMVVATHDVALARRVGRIVRMTDRLKESAA
jgi:ATP-binding cassette subfamily C protein CydD